MKKKLLSGILIIALLIGLCPAYTFEVDAKTENGKDVVEVETTAGQNELVDVDIVNENGKTIRTANKFITGNGMLVDYMSELIKNGKESEYKDS